MAQDFFFFSLQSTHHILQSTHSDGPSLLCQKLMQLGGVKLSALKTKLSILMNQCVGNIAKVALLHGNMCLV